jgi:hypothetical protein
VSDGKESKKAYFLDMGVYKQHLEKAEHDRMITKSHLHDCTLESAKKPNALIGDLCDYFILLNNFIDLLKRIGTSPTVPGPSNNGRDYVIGPEDALLLKFYIPMLIQFEQRVRSYGLSLSIH